MNNTLSWRSNCNNRN